MASKIKLSPSTWTLWPLALCFSLGAPALKAQVDTGAILGTIRDQSGAVIPGVKVTLINEGTSFAISTTTGKDGGYIFTPVKVGSYAVDAQFPGFQKVTRLHVTVDIQQQVVVDLTLVPGAITSTVEVTGASPLLQTQNASVGQVVEARAINDLPLNGRNFTFLAQLAAGVGPQQNGNGLATTGSFSANGVQPGQNNYMIDGIDNNSAIIDDRQGYQYVVLPPPDAVREFHVQTINYSAAIGRGGGAVLNATLKSGTNHFHGDFWEFVRNDKFDAANFFENAGAVKKGKFRQNQFGFTIGGPVEIPHVYNGKNKTFFFGDYQGTRVRQGSLSVKTVPTAAERASGFTNFQDLIFAQLTSEGKADLLGRSFPLGTLFDPATTRLVTNGQVDPVSGLPATANGYVRDPFYQGSLAGTKNFATAAAEGLLNMIPASRLDQNAIKLLSLYPAPTGSGIFNNYTANPVGRHDTNAFDVRVDHDFSERNQMFARYTFSQTNGLNAPPFPGLANGLGSGTNASTRSQHAALSETHVFSTTLVNEARLSFARLHQHGIQEFGDDLSNIPAQFGIRGIPQIPENGGLPNIAIGSLDVIGSPNFSPSNEFSMLSQGEENLTKTAGSHTMEVGFEIQHMIFPWNNPPYPRGSFTFNGQYTSVLNNRDDTTGIAQFLLTPTAASVPNGVNNVGGANDIQVSNFANHRYTRNYYGAYFQDNWRVIPKLTVNLGLRWEHFDPINEHSGALSNFVPGPPGAGAQYLVPARRAADVPQNFIAALAQDGIAFTPTNAFALAEVTTPASNWSPRVGLAYRLTPKLVVRSGYGIFYGFLQNLGGGPTLGNNFPFVYTLHYVPNTPQSPITPDNSIGLLENGLANIPLTPATLNPFGVSFNAFQLHAFPSATQGYNLTLQYQLLAETTLSIGYVGSSSYHLLSTHGKNQVSQILPPGTPIKPYIPYPDFPPGSGYLTTESNSNYNALLANLERRSARGFYFLGNFTWSNCRTDATDPLRNAVGNRFRAPGITSFPIQEDYGQCDFNVRRIAHVSGGYALPLGRGKRFLERSSAIVDGLVGGWQIQGILTVEDGMPFTIPCANPTTAVGVGCNALRVPGQDPYAGPHNVNRFLNPAAFANPPVATTIGQTDFAPLGGAPTQVNGPPLRRLDFSMFKEFRTSENTHLEFRAEAFNLPNTPSFNPPSGRNFNQTTFGQITSAWFGVNSQREIQFALKLYW